MDGLRDPPSVNPRRRLRYNFGRMEPVVELRDVTKRFGDRVAVDHVSLAAPRGQLYALLGPSGCGKTTTLRLIAGFEQPDQGDVLIHGSRVNEVPPYRRRVSTVFQNYALFPHLTVAENVAFGLRRGTLKLAEEEIRRRVERVLALVDLPGAAHRRPQSLSGGEKQRVALARSIVLEPDVLLLDEPLAALDPRLRREMRLELKRLQRAVEITFLFVTHDQEEALVLSDRIAVLNSGRLEQVGAPEEIYRSPRTRFVAGFIGSSNFIEGRVTQVENGQVELATAGGFRLRAAAPNPAPDSGAAAGLLVRPEAVRLVDGQTPAGAQRIPGKIAGTLFLGPHRQLRVEIEPGLAIAALVPASTSLPAEGSVELWWDPDDALVLGD